MAAAKAAVQSHGYNTLSFRELAKVVGVKSASVHYHFPTKGDLAAELAGRYADEATLFLDGLLVMPQKHDALMQKYTAAFRRALDEDNRMCLCGVMSAEYDDLPDAVRDGVDRFTSVNTRWLARVLAASHPSTPQSELENRALAIFAAIEGAQLVARGQKNIDSFDKIIAAYVAAGLFN